MNHFQNLSYALAASFAAAPIASSAQTVDELKRRTDDIVSLVEAEKSKSAFCNSFIGKTVAPMQFDRLALSLSGVRPKGEFESTAQYEVRQQTKGTPVTDAMLLVPIDRDFVKYNADAGVMVVSAGAFVSKVLSEDEEADMHLQLMMFSAGIESGSGFGRVSIPISSSERQTGSGVGRNILGAPIRVKYIERHTRGLSLDGARPDFKAAFYGGGIFPSARMEALSPDDTSSVMGFEVKAAEAARLKPMLRAVLVINPTAPGVVSETTDGARPTTQRPVRYTERATIIIGTPRCGLIVNAAMSVLTSAGRRAKAG